MIIYSLYLLFSQFGTSLLSMPGSNCCFLTCICIFQEAGQVIWYSHFLNNFPQFVVMHTVKGFGVVNKAKVNGFLEFSCFFYDATDVGNLIACSSAFLNPVWTSGRSRFMNYWSRAWRIFSVTLLACEVSAFVQLFEHSLAFPFSSIGMKLALIIL